MGHQCFRLFLSFLEERIDSIAKTMEVGWVFRGYNGLRLARTEVDTQNNTNKAICTLRIILSKNKFQIGGSCDSFSF